MKIIRSKEFRATRPWGALDIANMRGIATRLHWTNEPYHWHVNDGEEVFAILDGRVEMRFKGTVTSPRSSRKRAMCSSPWWALNTLLILSAKRAFSSSKRRIVSNFRMQAAGGLGLHRRSRLPAAPDPGR